MAGQKRACVEEVGERSELGHKRVKMRDLESVFRSEGSFTHYPKHQKNKQATAFFLSAENEMSQVTKETITMNLNAPLSERLRNGEDISQVVVEPALDLNANINMAGNPIGDNTPACVVGTNKPSSHGKQDIDYDTILEESRGFGLDLNIEDVASSMNHDSICPYKNYEELKLRDASECGSACGPLEEKDAMTVWKEMKQNGFLSSSHGVVPMPKPRGRKNKTNGIKKKMELARREQVDRFAKIAAPSGLLNGLNPGIINHVRNSKQVHSIIEALVRSERRENCHAGYKQEIDAKTIRIESSDMKIQENLICSGMNSFSHFLEDGLLNTFSGSRQTSSCAISSKLIRREDDSSLVERKVVDISNGFSYSYPQTQYEDDVVALKLSSSTATASENMSSLSNEASVNLTSVSSLSIKAADVASQWLELLRQDIKGRLSALRRSKKRVQAVIHTELPVLVSKEFASDRDNGSCITKISVTGLDNATADMHKARWSSLFDQMDKALSEEEKQLERWLDQVKEMQLHCGRGLFHCTGAPGLQQLGASESSCRLDKVDDLEMKLAVRAAAASIYSTCNFLQSMEKLPCF